MSSLRWLIIPVEVKHREFHARVILSALAASRGYRVLLGKDTMIRRLAPALPIISAITAPRPKKKTIPPGRMSSETISKMPLTSHINSILLSAKAT